MKRLLFIIGVQKSGTTLLSRLLQETGWFENPFEGEGDAFFGNEPPLAPEGFPAGDVYQRSGGAEGHAIGAEDANDRVRAELQARLRQLEPTSALPLNKNPYNSVRVRWLKALFPDSAIVAMVRRPVANSYSLAKKHVPHDKRGLAPDADGWWGVKPRGWRSLRDDDKLVQSARQWRAVNDAMADDADAIDRFVAYDDLCARPGECVADLFQLASGTAPRTTPTFAPLVCFDDEFQRGSRLRSKNRYFRERGDLSVPVTETPEFDALADEQVNAVLAICEGTEDRVRRLTSR